MIYYFCWENYYGALAQLGERIAGSDEVRGSIPLGSIQKGKPSHYVMAFLFVWTAQGANPGVQSARRKWLGCYEETASNERARRLNLPLKVLVEFASSVYNQDSDIPLGSIQKETPSHYVMAFLFVWTAQGANPGVQSAGRKWLGCCEETASNVRARRLNLPLKVLSESASSAFK